MARSFLGGEFAGGESAWWRGNWIPPILIEKPTFILILTKLSRKLKEFSRFDCICKCYDFVFILLL